MMPSKLWHSHTLTIGGSDTHGHRTDLALLWVVAVLMLPEAQQLGRQRQPQPKGRGQRQGDTAAAANAGMLVRPPSG
jgi:hypothetical protein